MKIIFLNSFLYAIFFISSLPLFAMDDEIEFFSNDNVYKPIENDSFHFFNSPITNNLFDHSQFFVDNTKHQENDEYLLDDFQLKQEPNGFFGPFSQEVQQEGALSNQNIIEHSDINYDKSDTISSYSADNRKKRKRRCMTEKKIIYNCCDCNRVFERNTTDLNQLIFAILKHKKLHCTASLFTEKECMDLKQKLKIDIEKKYPEYAIKPMPKTFKYVWHCVPCNKNIGSNQSKSKLFALAKAHLNKEKKPCKNKLSIKEIKQEIMNGYQR